MFASNNEYKIQKDRDVVKRWDWLLEGVDDNTKLNTAILLENSYKMGVDNGSIPNGWIETVLNEDEMLNEAPVLSTAVGSNLIPKILFPIIRRVMPSLIANKLFSVQPITQRTGVIYYMVYTYTNTKGEITAADEFTGNVQQGSPGYATFYSSEKIGPFTGTIAAAGSTTVIDCGTKISAFFGTETATLPPTKRIEVYNADTMTAYNMTTGTTNVANTSASFATGTNVHFEYGTYDIVIDSYNNCGTATGLAVGDDVIVYYVYNQENSSDIPELEISVGSQTVETTERKIKVRSTKEAEQDMKAYHQIDVDAELVKAASTQVNYEVDRETIKFAKDRIPSALSFLHDWEADAPGVGNNTSGNYLDRHRSLVQKIYQVAAKIAQYNRVSPATWILTTPQEAALLSMLPDFKSASRAGDFNIYSNGLLGGSLEVYVDPNGTANEMMMGYKSKESQYGAGVVYSPYVNWVSDPVTHPDTFTTIRGFFNRYALTMVPRGQWNYGKVTLMNYSI